MNIGVLLSSDPEAPSSWSGIPQCIVSTLRQHGCKVYPLGPLPTRYGWLTRILAKLSVCLRLKCRHEVDRTPWRALCAALAVEKMIRQLPTKLDFILALETVPLAFLGGKTPVVLWTDGTFERLYSTYPWYRCINFVSWWTANRLEKSAMRRCKHLCFASEWARNSAVTVYGVPMDMTSVLPFGANMDAPDRLEVEEYILLRPKNSLRILFCGIDWSRKGGDKLLLVCEALRNMGIPIRLDIVGPEHIDLQQEWITQHGRLDPRSSDGLKKLFLKSNFFVMLPRAECYGIVFCEAASCGLPAISHRVGGIPSAVTDGRSGILFDPRLSPDSIARDIAELWNSTTRYEQLCRSARQDYEEKHNWHVAIQSLLNQLGGIVGGNYGLNMKCAGRAR